MIDTATEPRRAQSLLDLRVVGAAFVLDDPVLQPVAPDTTGDHLSHNGNGPVVVEVGLANVTLRAGENVTSVKSWAYAATGDSRTLDTELRSGATVLASGSWPMNVAASWKNFRSAWRLIG